MQTLNSDPLVRAEKCGFLVEPIYFEQGLHKDARILVRRRVLEMLKTGRDNLPTGFNFKIWDGFRTTAVQQLLYDDLYKKLVHENPKWGKQQIHEGVLEFVAEPTKDPVFAAPHNTGGAVDLTIVDAAGVELRMGTPFDHFDKES